MVSPVLLFLPGTLCTPELFSRQVNYLSEKFSDLSIEALRFCQESSLEQMTLSTFEVVNNRPFILAGFSMGGFIIFEILRKNIENHMGSILINSNCHADLPGRDAMRLDHLEEAKSTGIRALIKNKYLSNYLAKPNNHMEQFILDMAENCGIDVFTRQLNILASRPDSLETLRLNTRPLLIIGGEEDKICPKEHQHLMAINAPKAEIHSIDKCAHFSPLEQPEQINRLIKLWIRKEFDR